MKKKTLSLLVSAVMAMSVFAGCGSSDNGTTTTGANSDGKTTVKALGEFDPQISGQQIIAQEKGFFEEEGLDVDLELLTDPSITTTMIASGEAQFYSASNYQDILLKDKDTDVSVIAPVVNAGNTQVIVGGPNLKITSAKDLEGKKMGYTDGAGVIVAVKNMCNELGVDFDKIELVNLQAADMLASLERGDIDFFAAWEPWGLKAEAIGGKVLFTGTKSYLPENEGEDVNYLDFIVSVNTSSEYVKSNPEACEAYVRAMIKATDYINENTEDAAEIIAKKINLDKEECVEIMKKNSYAVAFDETYKNSCDSLAKYMKESGMTSSEVAFDAFNDTSILKSIDATKVAE